MGLVECVMPDGQEQKREQIIVSWAPAPEGVQEEHGAYYSS